MAFELGLSSPHLTAAACRRPLLRPTPQSLAASTPSSPGGPSFPPGVALTSLPQQQTPPTTAPFPLSLSTASRRPSARATPLRTRGRLSSPSLSCGRLVSSPTHLRPPPLSTGQPNLGWVAELTCPLPCGPHSTHSCLRLLATAVKGKCDKETFVPVLVIKCPIHHIGLTTLI
jgi:hypothetical protein